MSTCVSTAPRGPLRPQRRRRADRSWRSPIGGENIGETVEGLQRFPDQRALSARVARLGRASCAMLPIVTERGAQTPTLGAVADHRRHRRPAACCEARTRGSSGWVYVDMRGRDLESVVARGAEVGSRRGRTAARLLDLLVGPVRISGARDGAAQLVVPVTLLIIFVLLYLTFRRVRRGAADHGARCRSRWSAASGCCVCSATTCRSRAAVGLHRARRRRRRIRRRHADLSRHAIGKRAAANRYHTYSRSDRRDSRKAPCCACGRRR